MKIKMENTNNGVVLPQQIVENNMEAAVGKVNMPLGKMILLGIFAGMFIAGGAAASSVAMHAVTNVGVSRLLGGCIFPVGLMMIVFIGGELFTGDGLMIMGCVHKKFSVLKMIRVLVVVYMTNLLGAVVMIIGMLVILFFVKEPDSRIKVQGEMNQAADAEARRKAEKEAAKAEKEARKKEKLTSGERRSLIFMLMGLFFLFCGTNAISTFFALFADEILHKTAAQATIMTTAFAAASAVAAIPAGWLGKKFGRKKTILGGLAIFIVAFGAYLLTEILHINALSGALIWVALVVGGAANMFITVNTLPLVLEIGGIDKVGTFTGYYYTATFSAQIATPIIYGIVRMLTGTYMSLFYYCPIAFILSTLCILVVRHGEAIPDEIVEKIKEENED